MAADVGPAYCGWSPESAEQQQNQEISVSGHDFSSFGSFKFGSLDWERRSVFTRNRCQEELEKLRIPGLVAQKKAYFEERHKKIRAQKAVEENQQLILNGGGADSISSQVKVEAAVHIESIEDRAKNVLDAHSEVTSTLQKPSYEDMQLQKTSSTLHSSIGGWLEINKETTGDCSLHVQNMHSESSILESFTGTEVIEHHSHMNIDDRDTSRSIGDGAKNVLDAHSEVTSFEVTLQKPSCEDMQLQKTSSTLHSSTVGWLEIDTETTDDCSLHVQNLHSESSMLESLRRTEVIEHHSHMNIDDRDTSRRLDYPELTAQLKKDSSGSDSQIYHRDTQVTGCPSLVQAELVEESQFSGHYDKDISIKNSILESNVDLATAGTVIHDAVKSDDKDISSKNCFLESNVDLATAVTVIHHTNSDAVKSDSHIAQDKAKSLARKRKDNGPVAKVMKGPVASARNGLKVDFKSQTITSQSPKHLFQKLVGKAKNTLGPSNETSDKVSRNIRLSPVASHKPLTGACSKSTIRVPVSLGTERRTRDNAQNLQDTSKKAARTCSVNNEGSDDRRPTSHRGRVTNLPEPLKDQKNKEPENRRAASEQAQERRPTSRRGRVPNLPEPPLKDQKNKEPETSRAASDQVQERRPTSRRGRVPNLSEPQLKDQKKESENSRAASEQVQERRPTSRRGSEQVRERVLPGGPMLRVAKVPEPPKDLRSKGSENSRGSEQITERRPTSHRGRVTNLPEPLKAQKSKEPENRSAASEQVQERRPTSRRGRVPNLPEPPLKDQNNKESENSRGSEQFRERALPGGPMLRVANVPEPPKDQRSKGSENLRGSEEVRERVFPGGPMLRVANVPEPPKDKRSKGSENLRGSEEVRERVLPGGPMLRVANVPEPPKDKRNKGSENSRGSEEVRERVLPGGPMLRVAYIPEPPKDKRSKGSENLRGSEEVRERVLPGGPMLRVVNVPEPPKDKRSKGSENLRVSEQVQERALPGGPMLRVANVSEPPKGSENLRGSEQRERGLPAGRVVVVSDPPKAKISRSVNLPAQNQSNPHGGVYRSIIALRKDELNEVGSSRADPFSHKGKRPLSGSRSQNGTLPRQEMRPWR